MKINICSILKALPIFFICISAESPTYRTYQFNYENVLGTSFELKVNATSENTAGEAEQTALDEIDRLNNILSTYKTDSEISRWLKTYQTEEPVSPELLEVFALFDQWRNKTSGALNVSAAIAFSLWKTASIQQQLPDKQELAHAVALMKQSHWSLNTRNQTAVHLSRQPLVLNSFVKSYIINKVSDKIMAIPGVKGAVVNVGGDMVVAGEQKEIIHITNPLANAENDAPLATLSLQNKAIATSGNYRRGFQIATQWYSHILDARTAMPVSEIISASVVAGDATTAGALATTLNILSPVESAQLASIIPGIEYLIVTRAGEEIASAGWKELISDSQGDDFEGEANNSEEQFELTIDLELARFEGRSHRPFVAVWVENKKKESVRTVSVWFNKTRWLPDLKKWFNKNQSVTQDYSTLGSISSATRSAGKYTLVWDGLDDSGKAVPSDKYTLYIEAAREHGTYQLIRQEINWKGKPDHFDLEGGIEITSASVDLHLKTSK